MKLKWGSSEETLYSRFFNMYALSDAYLISYRNVITRSLSFPSLTSRLHRSKIKNIFLSFPLGCHFESKYWWIIPWFSSVSRSNHINWSWILRRKVSLSVSHGLTLTMNPSEWSLWDLNLSWREKAFFSSVYRTLFPYRRCCHNLSRKGSAMVWFWR